MQRIETPSIAMVLFLVPMAACSAIDPQVGPSQESCGVSATGAAGPSATGATDRVPYGGYSSSKPASSESCGIDAGSPCDDCEEQVVLRDAHGLLRRPRLHLRRPGDEYMPSRRRTRWGTFCLQRRPRAGTPSPPAARSKRPGWPANGRGARGRAPSSKLARGSVECEG